MRINYSFEDVSKAFHGQEPWFNVFLLKYITMPITFFLVNYTKVTPNIITTFSLISAIVSSIFFYNGMMIEGSVMYLVSYIFDAIDGKVARLTGKGSVYGSWFDIFVDRTVVFMLISSLSVYHFNSTLNEKYIFLGFFFLYLFLVGFESRYNIQISEYKKTGGKILRPGVKDCEQIRNNINGFSDTYHNWCVKNGIVKQPLSLVELLITLFVISPSIGMYIEILSFSIVLLVIRLLNQQRYWTIRNEV